MHCTRPITESVTWVGGCDRRLSRFENLFLIPNGVAYHSYLITDEKTALMDTVDASISRQFNENVEYALHGRELDYLVINHVEPDHCANIEALMLRYPNMKIVGNVKTHTILSQFYDSDMASRAVTVKDGDTLSLGKHTLRFFTAPMVHWPEVMMTYDESEKLLFTADAFGGFGALDGRLFDDEVVLQGRWMDDVRRYYANIVGKYGAQVQMAMKKVAGLEIRMLCPLHGLIWRSHIDLIWEKYQLWSKYLPEEKALAVFFGSMYGDTENAVNILTTALAERGITNLRVYDVSSTPVDQLIGEVFRCSHLLIGCVTYNNGIYPAMANVLHDMKALTLQNRTVGIIQNGTWAPASGKLIQEELAAMKGMTVLEPVVTLKSSLKPDSREQLLALADAIAESMS